MVSRVLRKVVVVTLMVIKSVAGLCDDGIDYKYITEHVRNPETGIPETFRHAEVVGTLSTKSEYESFTFPEKFIRYNSGQYVDFPLTIFRAHCLEGCYNLKRVTFSTTSQVTTIGDFSFAYCTNLSKISLPSSVTTIGGGAFHSCWGLKSFVLPPKVQELGTAAFSDCVNLTSFTFNTKLTSISDYCFYGCRSMPSVDIPYSVRKIGRHAFENCHSLTSVVLPINVAEVREYAFRNCTRLESMTFPDNKVKVSIRRAMFDSCISLETVVLPSTIFYVGDSAFCNCTRLREVVISEETDSIGHHAFHNCRRIRRLEIPSTMERIGDSAFMGCEQLDSVYVRLLEPYAFGTDAFKDISGKCVLMVPYGLRQAYIEKGWTEQVFRGGVKEMPEPEGIRSVRYKSSSGRYYDLQGREVKAPRRGGIYILNGRKVKMK